MKGKMISKLYYDIILERPKIGLRIQIAEVWINKVWNNLICTLSYNQMIKFLTERKFDNENDNGIMYIKKGMTVKEFVDEIEYQRFVEEL